jgi:hypothetical protein
MTNAGKTEVKLRAQKAGKTLAQVARHLGQEARDAYEHFAPTGKKTVRLPDYMDAIAAAARGEW